jgi:hypothetical protein
VRRVVIGIDAIRRRRLLNVLEYIELRCGSIDDDMYSIELLQLRSFKVLFTTEDDNANVSISFTHEELFVLSIIIQAAQHLTRRDGHEIPDAGRRQLEDLHRWAETSERWFITPLKFELLHFDPEMHRRITEVLWYVENRAEIIDPDMFRIDVEKVQALQQLFRAELARADDPPSVAVVCFKDVNTLAYYTMAAQEYSARSTEKGLLDVTPAQLDEMLTWLSHAEDRLRMEPS